MRKTERKKKEKKREKKETKKKESICLKVFYLLFAASMQLL
jgi:hypothetical protein